MEIAQNPVRGFLFSLLTGLWLLPSSLEGAELVIIDTAMPPPAWALLERQVLKSSADASRLYFDRYFDDRGYLLCVERWGGDDGPDDAIECCNDWPLLHALGGTDEVLEMFITAWEGHLRQYTQARTSQVPLARDGMYYKEFPVMFDWVHLGEGLRAFCQLGLSRPADPRFKRRIIRYAGFYLNEDPGAMNYDPRHRLIRSLFNGSRGPLLRKATALDWAGDPIEVAGRFQPRHGEENYAQMLEHFQDYTDIVGDHPQNLCATSLALYAYLLTHETKYKDWLIEYVDAWLERTRANGGVIPTNIGLDGTLGGAAGGKWYGGTYGWSFSVKVPQTGETAHRNTHQLGLAGFGNAFLLTGDTKYVDVWRNMIDTINAQGKRKDGRQQYPTMYGDQGWYAFRPTPYTHGIAETWYWQMAAADRARMPNSGWLQFLEGQAEDYPANRLAGELETIRQKVQQIRADTTTPDTRLADDPLAYNPVSAAALVELMCGGLPPGAYATPLHLQFRYFDPQRRRAGIPQDVAALVTQIGPAQSTVVLVNLSPIEPRRVLVQGGAYGEHRLQEVRWHDQRLPLEAAHFEVLLQPGCGAALTVRQQRYRGEPTLHLPWSIERSMSGKVGAGQRFRR